MMVGKSFFWPRHAPPEHPGYTLSQTGLSIRWGKSADWIRRQGNSVTWNRETWARMEYHTNGRCAGYKLISVEAI